MFKMLRLNIGCLAVIAYVCFVFYSAKRQKTIQHKLFSILVTVASVNIVFDAVTIYTVNHLSEIPDWVNHICHIIFIGSLECVIYLCFIYTLILINEQFVRNKIRFTMLLLILAAALLCIIFLPMDYMETPDGNYSYGPAVNVAYCSIAAFLFGVFILTLLNWNKIDQRKRKAIFMANICQMLISIYQIFNPTALISGIGVTMIVLSFFLTVESPDTLLIENLKYEKKRADEANEAKSRFLANISHEIRTPINAFIGMNEMILRESRQKEITGYAQDAKNAAGLLLMLINDILDFSKMESGKMEIVPVEYDMRSLLHDEYIMFASKAESKGLELEFDIDAEIPCKLVGDDIRIKQVVTNLISNAVKYTNKGKIVLSVKQSFCDDQKTVLDFKVSDTGIGIKKEDMEKLFEAFQRLEEKRNRNIQGTGLGINISLQLLNLMGSQLHVQSKYGEGSEFFFTIEQKISDPEKIGKFTCSAPDIPEAEKTFSTLEAKDVKILVVDDNPMNISVFKNYIKADGITVDEAENGYKCCELVTKNVYDIIFMDHMMPGMDGVETLHKLKEMPDNLSVNTPVIMLTANAAANIREKFLNQGFADYLSKPIDSSKLIRKIAAFLPDKVKVKKMKINHSVTEKTELPAVDGMDLKYAQSHFAYNEQLMESIKMFLRISGTDAAQLNEIYAEKVSKGEFSDYRTKVHSMKSTAAVIGLIPLAGMAKILENAAASADQETIFKLHDVFVKNWTEYKNLLKVFQTDEEKKEKPLAAENLQSVENLLKALAKAAEDVELDSLDEIMKMLNEYEYNDDKKDLISKLNTAVEMFDTEKVSEITKNYFT